jgi:hypothetical protein
VESRASSQRVAAIQAIRAFAAAVIDRTFYPADDPKEESRTFARLVDAQDTLERSGLDVDSVRRFLHAHFSAAGHQPRLREVKEFVDGRAAEIEAALANTGRKTSREQLDESVSKLLQPSETLDEKPSTESTED